MAEDLPLKRFDRAADAVNRLEDPLQRLDAARRLREHADGLEAAAVHDARHAGVTWKAIGAIYGLSKQGAQQRFRAPTTTGSDPGRRDDAEGSERGR